MFGLFFTFIMVDTLTRPSTAGSTWPAERGYTRLHREWPGGRASSSNTVGGRVPLRRERPAAAGRPGAIFRRRWRVTQYNRGWARRTAREEWDRQRVRPRRFRHESPDKGC
jgi:hypothetical protein